MAASFVAVGVGIPVMGYGEDHTALLARSESAPDKKVMDAYRKDDIHLLEGGGVRIDIPEDFDGEAMSRALNAEGFPVRFWAVQGATGEWEAAPEYSIDPERGLGMSKEPSGEPYPMVTSRPSTSAGSAPR